ncbi:MAG: PD40 domain-containing protein, partial [Acidobacteriota bacterium]
RLVLPGWQNSPLSNRESQGTWTGDGKYFFFTSVREGLNHLWALRKETPLSLWKTPAPMRVTPGPLDVYEPLGDRSPERIFCKATKPRAALSRYVKETGTLEPYLSGISAEMIDFSKDGEWVVYIALPEASLVRSRIDGGERLQLTSPPLQATAPSWSPDGKQIGFMARMPGEGMQEHRIYLVTSSGDNLRMVQTGLGPSWSPDGRYLLFEHSSPSNPEAFHILDLKTNLVTDIPGSSDKSVPRWSPDGRYIAATADYWSKVAVFEFETQNWRTLTTYRGATLEEPGTRKGGGDGAFYPTWSHDGQWVFFIDWTPGFAGIYRISLSGGEPELVLDMMNPRTTPRTNYPGTLGGWFGLAPDDSILVAVQATEDEIYAIEWEDG